MNELSEELKRGGVVADHRQLLEQAQHIVEYLQAQEQT